MKKLFVLTINRSSTSNHMSRNSNGWFYRSSHQWETNIYTDQEKLSYFEAVILEDFIKENSGENSYESDQVEEGECNCFYNKDLTKKLISRLPATDFIVDELFCENIIIKNILSFAPVGYQNVAEIITRSKGFHYNHLLQIQNAKKKLSNEYNANLWDLQKQYYKKLLLIETNIDVQLTIKDHVRKYPQIKCVLDYYLKRNDLVIYPLDLAIYIDEYSIIQKLLDSNFKQAYNVRQLLLILIENKDEKYFEKCLSLFSNNLNDLIYIDLLYKAIESDFEFAINKLLIANCRSNALLPYIFIYSIFFDSRKTLSLLMENNAIKQSISACFLIPTDFLKDPNGFYGRIGFSMFSSIRLANCYKENGYLTPLYIALMFDKFEIAEILLMNGARIQPNQLMKKKDHALLSKFPNNVNKLDFREKKSENDYYGKCFFCTSVKMLEERPIVRNNGFYLAEIDGKRCLVDELDRIITPYRYSDTSKSFMKYSSVYFDGKWGLIDQNGIEILPTIYEEMLDFSADGWAKVSTMLNDKQICRYINVEGEFLKGTDGKELIFQNCTKFFHYSLASVCLNNKWGLLNSKGILVGQLKYDAPLDYFYGWAKASITTNGKKLFQFIDPYGRVMKQNNDDLFFDDADNFGFYIKGKLNPDKGWDKSVAFVNQNGKIGILNLHGFFIIHPLFEEILYDSETMVAIVRIRDKWGICYNESIGNGLLMHKNPVMCIYDKIQFDYFPKKYKAYLNEKEYIIEYLTSFIDGEMSNSFRISEY